MNRYFLLTSLLLTGCATLDNHSIYRDADGLYRAQINGQKVVLLSSPEQAVRDQSGQLITDEKVASERLRALKSPFDLQESFKLPNCGLTTMHKAKSAQFRAEEMLHAEKYEAALEALREAEQICESIGRVSAQNYFRAAALLELKREGEAKAAADLFLRESAAYEPDLYWLGNGPGTDDDMRRWTDSKKVLSVLRQNAENFIKTGAPLSLPKRVEKIAKYPHNAFFRPGGNEREGFIVLPGFSYGTLAGFNAGAAGYYSWGNTALGASYMGGDLGSFYGFRVRRSLFESSKRDLNVDIFTLGMTRKELVYSRNGNEYMNIKVVGESFDAGGGLGMTKRWTPQIGVAVEGLLLSNHFRDRLDARGSVYAFYDFISEIGISTGYIHNRPMIAVTIGFMHLGYNFKDEGLDLVLQTFSF